MARTNLRGEGKYLHNILDSARRKLKNRNIGYAQRQGREKRP